ncbi:MAG: hypothetical protein Q8N03_17075 [Ignavibacteria bacterium]|nr:hypothetical protein [Ignavibacteria bacterium]
MSGKAKREYLEEIKKRYFTSTKLGKVQILDEFCTNCSYNRKYAIRLIHKKKSPKQKKRAGRPNGYYKESIIRFLKVPKGKPLAWGLSLSTITNAKVGRSIYLSFNSLAFRFHN